MPVRRLTPLLSPALCGVVWLCVMTGCTPDEEKITRMIQEHLDRCKKAEGDIAQIQMSDGTADAMLVEACSEPVTDIVVNPGIEATAKTGPYTWEIVQNTSSGVWIASNLDWSDFHTSMRILEDSESDDAVLAGGAEKMAAAQQAYPTSTFVRLKRMELLLRLRKVMRSKSGQDDPNGLGKEAQGYYEELLTWGAAEDHKEMVAELRVMVVTYLKGLESFIEDSIGTLGYGDDNLETSISVAEKEKDEESAAAYRKELEESRARRPAQLAALEARQAAIQAKLCEEVAGLDAQGIEDDALKQRVVSLKGSVSCVPAAPPAADGP